MEILENNHQLKSAKAFAQYQVNTLKKMIQFYYSGRYNDAGNCIKALLTRIRDNPQCHLIAKLSDLYADKEKDQWFRSRISNGQVLRKKDLKHIPYTMRSCIGNNRYSINGIPCLYLANSIYTCWEEMGRPTIDTLWSNRYHPVKEITLLNLSTTIFEVFNSPDYLKYVIDENTYSDACIDFFSNWVLQSACSVQVKETNRSFQEEYIIPQILMQYIQEYNIDGVIYFSTKVENAYVQATGWISKCIAIPAFDCEDGDHSSKIDAMFASSTPINIGLYQQGIINPKHEQFHPSTNSSRNGALIYPTAIGEIYQNSIFYRCEIELIACDYGLDAEIKRLLSTK